MKVCVIGGSGFVGSRLIELIKSEYSVLNIDKQDSPYFPEISVLADVRNFDSLIENLKNTEVVILLAAEHRDDVSPTSLYYDVNVEGTKNVLKAMDILGVKSIIFTSSVAIYGLNKVSPNEQSPSDPFNHYGKSKWAAEEVLRDWYKVESENKSLTIVRPTVIFGERNRGNVFNLLSQISSGKFFMIGSGKNFKSMAYVGNIVAFLKYQIDNLRFEYNVYNYVDTPDLNMNQLVSQVEFSLDMKIPPVHIPYWIGKFAGYFFDFSSKITNKKLAISSVRIKKFCATTQYDASKAHKSGFKAPFTLNEGLNNTLNYEFRNDTKDDITFVSE